MEVASRATGGLSETIVAHAHSGELTRQSARCPQCDRRLTARPVVARTVQTRVGPVQVERPYFYCTSGCGGIYPFDQALALAPGRTQLDVQQAAAQVAIEMPYEEAQTLFSDLTGVALGSERLHTFVHHAEGLTVLDVAPSRDAIARRIETMATGRVRRPVVVLGIDGAYVPTRPGSARERQAGQRHSRARRASWHGQWRDAKGFRFYLIDDEPIVHLLSWHQVQNEAQLGEALQQVKEAGVIPQDQVRLCVVCDGASWIWKHVQSLFPRARQVLDYYHCKEYLHKVAKVQYESSAQALEWVEATLTRLYLGKVGWVLGGLRRMQPASEAALKAIDNCWVYLQNHRARTHYGKLRRGAIPLAVVGLNRRTNSFVMYGSSALGHGGTSATAMRCWHCAAPSITVPSIGYLNASDSDFERRKNRPNAPEVVVPIERVAATTPQAQETSLYNIDTHYGTVAPLGRSSRSCPHLERHPGQTMRSMRPAIERVMPRAPLQRVVAPCHRHREGAVKA